MTRGSKWQIVAVQVLLFGAVQAWVQIPVARADTPPMDSFKAIQAYFDDKIEQSHKEIESQRLAVLEKFLPKAPEADKEATLGSMIELTLGLEKYDRTVTLVDDFLKSFPKSEDAASMRKMRLAALAKSNKLDPARKDWTAFLAEAKPESMRDVLESGFQIAEAYADSGDTKSAKGIYVDIRDKLPNAVPDAQERAGVGQQLEQMLAPRLDMLEWVGKTPPELRGKTLDGKTLDLNAYKGKVVLLDFWATWCQPCVASLPSVVETYQKNHDKGFEVVGVSLDIDQDQLKQFIQRQKLPWPQVWDNQDIASPQNPFGGPNTRRYSLAAIPATFLIDRDGKIARAGVSGRALGESVTKLLAKPASRPAGGAAAKP